MVDEIRILSASRFYLAQSIVGPSPDNIISPFYAHEEFLAVGQKNQLRHRGDGCNDRLQQSLTKYQEDTPTSY